MAAVEEKTTLDSGWFAARFNEVHFTGTQLTTTNPPCGPTLPWMESLVPGTVLGTLVKNKVVPVPFYGLENKLFWILLILEEIIILSRSLQLYSKCSESRELKVTMRKTRNNGMDMDEHKQWATAQIFDHLKFC
ncbi:mannosylglycoprotein endo-beta-mannosidase [Trifolium repens]|nr:mannosylglycoprotein endo-beta-mannosidase [Trifolium repens]WJX72382.1 mannosylglycoprotein endo-beta-mannosidase [Trifolium repens]